MSITESVERLAAGLRVTIPREEIRTVMGPGLKEVHAALAALGVNPAGPWFTRHFRMDPKVFDFQICVPTAEPIAKTGRVEATRLPSARVARTVFHGNYQGLPDAWREFDEWLAASGYEPEGGLWEVYAVGPESGTKPEDWRTELYRPLAG
ncbi:MAG TPA: GyrI-like domain-containing protein [Vicinamibacterales bacterium]|nr:GyrI-like domain-containing protein [Vicinamibacterales bacterium]